MESGFINIKKCTPTLKLILHDIRNWLIMLILYKSLFKKKKGRNYALIGLHKGNIRVSVCCYAGWNKGENRWWCEGCRCRGVYASVKGWIFIYYLGRENFQYNESNYGSWWLFILIHRMPEIGKKHSVTLCFPSFTWIQIQPAMPQETTLTSASTVSLLFCWAQSCAYLPALDNRTSCGPCSTTLPFSRTIIWEKREKKNWIIE